ncbi:hypothetical protein, partial [Moorena sp. SIO3I6]|uniref:hypothetical protein n=1 Tax=Moorena sp. SIO3I6 TaxID=2607831 RepID=UPI0025E5F662
LSATRTLREQLVGWAKSDAARSWEGSAVLGVPPMSDCRGFPHSRFASRHSLIVLSINDYITLPTLL